MELQCEIAVNAAKEKIWPYYVNPDLRYIWEGDLESIVFDSKIKTGATGRMKLKEMPEMQFTLTEVIECVSYCDKTDVPGM
ncbi:MAG: polyketide cyclase, partial [Clostridiales bacterium]|nr:polyketide cyclase [Clostridiales bacterium]